MPRPEARRPLNYEDLLDWLSKDRATANREFGRIREQLVRIFGGRGCRTPEDLADEVMDRVARNVTQVAPEYEGNPARYFYAVAGNVHHEYLRQPVLGTLDREPRAVEANDETEERNLKCLDECLDKLKGEEQSLILDYYRLDRSDKAVNRKAIASRTGMGLNALRIRAHRIRNTLFECVTDCLQAA